MENQRITNKKSAENNNKKTIHAKKPVFSLETRLESGHTGTDAKPAKKNTKSKNILSPIIHGKNSINPSIASILFSKILENFKSAKDEKKNKPKEEHSYRIIGEVQSEAGGYGTVSRNYGTVQSGSYVDYDRLFSYLGDFKANSSPYSQNGSGHIKDSSSKDNFFFGGMQSMEKAIRHFKYFSPSNNIDTISMVPVSGMSSGEWEDFKLWMKIDPVMYRLKTSTS